MGEWDLMKWNYEGSALKTKPKKVFNVPKEDTLTSLNVRTTTGFG